MLLFCIFVGMVNYSHKNTSAKVHMVHLFVLFVLFVLFFLGYSSVFSAESRKQWKQEGVITIKQMPGGELNGIIEPASSIDVPNYYQRYSFGIKNLSGGGQWGYLMKYHSTNFQKIFNLNRLFSSTPLYITNRVLLI